jgi:hypothetical protein
MTLEQLLEQNFFKIKKPKKKKKYRNAQKIKKKKSWTEFKQPKPEYHIETYPDLFDY